MENKKTICGNWQLDPDIEDLVPGYLEYGDGIGGELCVGPIVNFFKMYKKLYISYCQLNNYMWGNTTEGLCTLYGVKMRCIRFPRPATAIIFARTVILGPKIIKNPDKADIKSLIISLPDITNFQFAYEDRNNYLSKKIAVKHDKISKLEILARDDYCKLSIDYKDDTEVSIDDVLYHVECVSFFFSMIYERIVAFKVEFNCKDMLEPHKKFTIHRYSKYYVDIIKSKSISPDPDPASIPASYYAILSCIIAELPLALSNWFTFWEKEKDKVWYFFHAYDSTDIYAEIKLFIFSTVLDGLLSDEKFDIIKLSKADKEQIKQVKNHVKATVTNTKLKDKLLSAIGHAQKPEYVQKIAHLLNTYRTAIEKEFKSYIIAFLQPEVDHNKGTHNTIADKDWDKFVEKVSSLIANHRNYHAHYKAKQGSKLIDKYRHFVGACNSLMRTLNKIMFLRKTGFSDELINKMIYRYW